MTSLKNSKTVSTEEKDRAPSPLLLITEVLSGQAADGIHGIGAHAALGAMLPFWREHVEEGHGPDIFLHDIDALIDRLHDVRERISAHCA